MKPGGSRASLFLAAGLTWVSLQSGDVAPLCEGPVERAAHRGWSVAVACGGGAARELRGPARLLFGERLDANQADARTFEVLPGIGPTRAGALVDARSEAPFCAPSDLERARGVGPVVRARIAPWLELDAAACGRGD